MASQASRIECSFFSFTLLPTLLHAETVHAPLPLYSLGLSALLFLDGLDGLGAAHWLYACNHPVVCPVCSLF